MFENNFYKAFKQINTFQSLATGSHFDSNYSAKLHKTVKVITVKKDGHVAVAFQLACKQDHSRLQYVIYIISSQLQDQQCC